MNVFVIAVALSTSAAFAKADGTPTSRPTSYQESCDAYLASFRHNNQEPMITPFGRGEIVDVLPPELKEMHAQLGGMFYRVREDGPTESYRWVREGHATSLIKVFRSAYEASLNDNAHLVLRQLLKNNPLLVTSTRWTGEGRVRIHDDVRGARLIEVVEHRPDLAQLFEYSLREPARALAKGLASLSDVTVRGEGHEPLDRAIRVVRADPDSPFPTTILRLSADGMVVDVRTGRLMIIDVR